MQVSNARQLTYGGISKAAEAKAEAEAREKADADAKAAAEKALLLELLAPLPAPPPPEVEVSYSAAPDADDVEFLELVEYVVRKLKNPHTEPEGSDAAGTTCFTIYLLY